MSCFCNCQPVRKKGAEGKQLPTRVHPWRGTSHERGTVGPGLSQSHPPSSAEPAAGLETGTGTNVNDQLILN